MKTLLNVVDSFYPERANIRNVVHIIRFFSNHGIFQAAG